jgi:hypothetical protein
MEIITVSPFATPPAEVAERIRTQPECHLLWSVLQEGMETYMRYAAATNRRGRRLFTEAETWIFEDDPTWLCSFLSICHVLGLDPEYLRAGLKRWRAGQGPRLFEQAA